MPPIKSPAKTGNLGSVGGTPQPCLLTWYDPALGGTNSASGRPEPNGPTASGEAYDPNKDTCAAPPNYSFGTLITFFYQGRAVTCKVNDRGGAIQGSHFDLSRHAANVLGMIQAGSVNATFIVGAATAGAFHGGPTGSTGGGGGSGGGGPSSILDILTSPLDVIGGWLAGIAVNLAKDAAIGFFDVIIVPAWHWNQRAVMSYYQEVTSKDGAWPMLPWTAAFWGLGYWLLWTDPDSKGLLKPAPVAKSRLARHTRRLQAIPARRSLVKPKNVAEKTPRKPKPVMSRARIKPVETLQTERTQRVRVTHAGSGTDVNRGNAPARSRVPVEREGTLQGAEAERLEKLAAETKHSTREPHEKHRTGDSSREGSGGVTTRGATESSRNGDTKPRRRHHPASRSRH